MTRKQLFASLLLVLLSMPFAAIANTAEVSCTMRFNMHGWSAFYKTAEGTGTIKCSNGQTMAVNLNAKGGGLTFGKNDIDDGIGKFSGIYDIREILGTYVSAEAHAGATKSAKAQAMTKGTVSLALSGKGRGWDLGVAFGKFVISRR